MPSLEYYDGTSWQTVGTGTVKSITAGIGLSGGTITNSGTINLSPTTVVAGSYTSANITVDLYGRITSAESGPASAPANATFILQQPNISIPQAQSLSTLSSGILKNNVSSGAGVLSIARDGTDYVSPNLVVTIPVTSFAKPTTNFDLNNHRLINVIDPTNAKDAATKSYVDSKYLNFVGDVTGSGTLNSSNINLSISSTISPVFQELDIDWSAEGANQEYNNFSMGFIVPMVIDEPYKEIDFYYKSADRGWINNFNIGQNFFTNPNYAGFYSLSFFSQQLINNGIQKITPLSIEVYGNGATNNSSISLNGNVLLNNKNISNLANPVNMQDAATKNYVDTQIANRSGTVTSIGITGSTGLTISGSPITSDGTIALTLAPELQGLSSLSVNGLVTRSSLGGYTSRALTAGAGINITNADGVSGNPTISTINQGTVTNVGILGSSGINVYGSPITSSGMIILELTNPLAQLSNIASGVGFVVRTSAGQFAPISLTAGTGISITNGNGSNTSGLSANAIISATNTGTVTSVAISGSTGLAVSGSPITNSGTVSLTLGSELQGLSGLATNGIVTRTASGSYASVSLTSGTGISITNGNGVSGNPIISATNTGTVTSISVTGSTGLTVSGSPITTSGTVSLTLGTELQGLSSLATTGLVARTSSGTYVPVTLTAGSGITITNGNGVLGNPTISASASGTGTVTSVAISGGTGILVSGSPITSSGTISLSLSGIPISSISGYPASSSYYLNGGGSWAIPYINNLQVNGNINLGSYGINTSGTLNATTGGITTNNLSAYNSIAINVASPLNINSGYNVTLGWFGYLNSTGSTGRAYGTASFSIVANNRIAATEFDATSSIKIKNVIDRGCNIEKEALDLFNKIDLVKYCYKDKLKEGYGEYFGVIAEELKNISPNYVSDRMMFVPNIMDIAEIKFITDNSYLLNFNKYIPNVSGDRVKIITDSKELDVEILTISENSITIYSIENIGCKAFVYGTYENCPTVSKNKLFELSMVVIKNIINRINYIESNILHMVQ